MKTQIDNEDNAQIAQEPAGLPLEDPQVRQSEPKTVAEIDSTSVPKTSSLQKESTPTSAPQIDVLKKRVSLSRESPIEIRTTT
eukprot:UN06869